MAEDMTKLRAWVIDDDPSILDFVELLLSSLGMRHIQTFLNAQDVLDRLQAQSDTADVILCDLDMPDMDGIEFLRHLADTVYSGGVGIISGADTRVISSVERLAKTHNLHFLGYLEKHHLDASLLSTLLSGAMRQVASHSHLYTQGFQEHEIRRAIAAKELDVYYQAKVNCQTGRTVGAEALVRWHHPQHGLVKPAQFIESAERYKLIDALSYVVAEQAINALSQWHAQGWPLHLSINISAQSLYSLDLPETLMDYLEQKSIAPTYLTLELTESQVLQELSAPMEILTRLCLKSLGLSIDDFGTGYASLEQLNRLPFTELKIDKSFIQDACRDESAKIIAESSVSMVKRLGMKVVAEGVEDEETFELVKAMGCDEAQGYWFGKPMPRADFEASLQKTFATEQIPS